MKLTINYFGLVAEITEKSDEGVECEENTSLIDLKQLLQTRYPKLEEVNYQWAVNQQIADAKTTLKTGDEIALLPPFAGG